MTLVPRAWLGVDPLCPKCGSMISVPRPWVSGQPPIALACQNTTCEWVGLVSLDLAWYVEQEVRESLRRLAEGQS